MKQKAQHISLIDDLRSQDSKQRLNSIQHLKIIATAIGPVKTRTDLIQYLNEFIDDQQSIVLELLSQLSDFSSVLGGEQHEKAMLPLLIAFCKTDQKKQAEKATQIIEGILRKNKSLILDTIKILDETEMTTSKESSAKLISSLIEFQSQNESQLIEIYSTLIYSKLSAYRIIGSKYLSGLLDRAKNKQQVGKIIESVYNETDDLPKIFALEALIKYYSVNPTSSLSKIKGLLVINNWRINIKICEHLSTAAKIFNKAHFKAAFESSLLKFLDSPEPQLRVKACETIRILALMISEQDIKKTLIPIIKKLSLDQYDFVKIGLSQNIISLVQVCSGTFLYDQILPIIFTFMKSNNLAVGIIKNFDALSKKLTKQVLEQKLVIPLANQLSTQDWKMKCRMLQLLENVVTNKDYLNEKMVSTFVNLVSDRINAVRQRATHLVIKIIREQPSKWCDEMIIPKLMNLKNNQNYNVRQELLEIIEKTIKNVSEKTLNQFYKQVLLTGLVDKVSNVRAKALKAAKSSQKLFDKIMEKHVQKLKEDSDQQVKELALEMVKV